MARIETKDMLSTRYDLQNVSVEWVRPKAATTIARLDARMAELRKNLRIVREDLARLNAAKGKAA